jgi:hypothetical protein
MPINYPSSLDALANPDETTYADDAGLELDVVISKLNDIAEAVETKLGTGASTPTTAGHGLYVTGAGATAYGARFPILLAELTGAGSSGVFDFTGIPATFRALYLQIVGRSSNASVNTTVGITLNNDSGANYDRQQVLHQAATVTASEALAQSSMFAGYMPAASASADIAGSLELLLPDYAGTTFQKTGLSRNAGKYGTSTTNFIQHEAAHAWRNTAAISRVTATLVAGNWVTGSRASLWGLPA